VVSFQSRTGRGRANRRWGHQSEALPHPSPPPDHKFSPTGGLMPRRSPHEKALRRWCRGSAACRLGTRGAG
jgi:hypothetical protein